MTEDEARTKWCPFARVSSASVGGGNRYPFEHDLVEGPFARCLGSLCMAWRWRTTPDLVERNNALADRNPGTHYTRVEPAGFCGLAGTP